MQLYGKTKASIKLSKHHTISYFKVKFINKV